MESIPFTMMTVEQIMNVTRTIARHIESVTVIATPLLAARGGRPAREVYHARDGVATEGLQPCWRPSRLPDV